MRKTCARRKEAQDEKADIMIQLTNVSVCFIRPRTGTVTSLVKQMQEESEPPKSLKKIVVIVITE